MKTSVAIIQAAISENPKTNREFFAAEATKAAKNGAQIIAFPELFTTPYFCYMQNPDFFDLAETTNGETTRFLQDLARKLNVVIVGGSFFEEYRPGFCYNTSVVVDADGTILGTYRKTHIPQDPGFEEKYYFTPADENYQVFNTKFGKIAVLICWDQWFPEAARITALLGAEIIFYPTAIGWDLNEQSAEINAEQYSAWQTIQRAHAIANGIHIVAINRTGIEQNTQFWGGSFIANPMGTILYQAPHKENATHLQTLELDLTRQYRRIWPFLRDRRVDTYQNLLKRAPLL